MKRTSNNSFLRRKNYVTNDRYWKALRTTRLIHLSWHLIYYYFRRVRWYDKYLQFLKAWVRIWNYYNWIVIENVFARQHITENVLQRLIRFIKKKNSHTTTCKSQTSTNWYFQTTLKDYDSITKLIAVLARLIIIKIQNFIPT